MFVSEISKIIESSNDLFAHICHLTQFNPNIIDEILLFYFDVKRKDEKELRLGDVFVFLSCYFIIGASCAWLEKELDEPVVYSIYEKHTVFFEGLDWANFPDAVRAIVKTRSGNSNIVIATFNALQAKICQIPCIDVVAQSLYNSVQSVVAAVKFLVRLPFGGNSVEKPDFV
jgi:hypothetical protein